MHEFIKSQYEPGKLLSYLDHLGNDNPQPLVNHLTSMDLRFFTAIDKEFSHIYNSRKLL